MNDVIAKIESGELALARHKAEYGYVVDGGTDKYETELLRLAKLGQAAEKAFEKERDYSACKCSEWDEDICEQCEWIDFCKLRNEPPGGANNG